MESEMNEEDIYNQYLEMDKPNQTKLAKSLGLSQQKVNNIILNQKLKKGINVMLQCILKHLSIEDLDQDELKWLNYLDDKYAE